MNHHYEILLALGVLSPLVGFWLLVFFGPKLGKPAAGWVGVVLGMGVPFALATVVLVGWLGEVESGNAATLTANAFRYHWADMGDVPITIGVKLDSLTIAMYFMITLVALCIFIFSVGYMAGHSDEVDGKSKYHRFFAYLSLFAFSMLGLIVSSNILFLFIFWELVGLCSYLLIGFYFDKGFASRAAMKAFITNRVGDFGFLIGLMLMFFHLRTLDLDQAAVVFAEQFANHTGIFASSFTVFGWSLATIMGVGLFCGAMGKSAQFPLHVWLPDAMAGPTPVSALIHAATMVAAGVYLVARVFRLMTPDALMFVALIGCLTLTLMALIAIVQTDIKKCLAYSTLSQLGYMIFGLGVGAWVAALFHLITHAFFKAMMFLCSGQVIEGCHHEQDMRKMGGLLKKMPVTGVTFLIGVLAISGFGIAGLEIAGKKFGLGGFFSKDEILAVAWTRAFDWRDPSRHQEGHGEGGGESHVSTDEEWDVVAAAPELETQTTARAKASGSEDGETSLLRRNAGVLALPTSVMLASDPSAHHAEPDEHHGGGTFSAVFQDTPVLPKWMFYLALITAYITPFYMMRCWWMTFMGKPRDQHVYDHAHESPLMYVPLVVLAVGTLWASYFLFRPLIADASSAATGAAAVVAIDGAVHTPAIMAAHHWLVWGVGGAFLVGFVVAIFIYRRGLAMGEAIARLPVVSLLHTLLVRKYYIDEIYELLWVKGCLLIATMARFFDTYFIDLVFDTLAGMTRRLAAFSGLIIDTHGVDGFVNGIAKTARDVGDAFRVPQTGKIRHYVLFAAGVTAVVVFCVLVLRLDSAVPGVAVSSAAGL